jgi:phosphate acyltransferase
MSEIRVALDAMGGDHAPYVPVAAALQAASDYGIAVTLVGDETAIRRVLADHPVPDHLIGIVDAPETVSMEDDAVTAVRRKRRASIPVALELLKSGAADAFLSAGHTGAVVAASILSLGRLSGVARPGIAIQFPTRNGSPVLIIDAGALVDAKPEHLWQQARLASVYAEKIWAMERPRVALISNGEEPTKGNALTKSAHSLLSADPKLNFVGNIEARAIPQNQCEVIVTDGFTGNVILKTAEGTVSLLQDTLREEFKHRWYTALLASLLRPAFRRAGRALDYREYGGAPLLGVDGLVFISHGSSDRLALVNGIRAARYAVEQQTMEKLRAALHECQSEE